MDARKPQILLLILHLSAPRYADWDYRVGQKGQAPFHHSHPTQPQYQRLRQNWASEVPVCAARRCKGESRTGGR